MRVSDSTGASESKFQQHRGISRNNASPDSYHSALSVLVLSLANIYLIFDVVVENLDYFFYHKGSGDRIQPPEPFIPPFWIR